MRASTKIIINNALFCACAFILLLSSNAHSSVIVDQITVNIGTANLGAGAVGKTLGALGDPAREIEAAQSVTVGIGGYLSQVDVWVGRQSDTIDDLILSVLDVNGEPDATNPLASVVIPASSITSTSLFSFSMVAVDVRSANIFMNAGDSLAISLSAPSAPISPVQPVWPPYSWALDPSYPYADGTRFVRDLQLGPSWITSGADQALRTWMEPTAVPEPAAIWLFLPGLFAMGGMRVFRTSQFYRKKINT